MIIQSLIGEFEHEAENTRKLLKAIPDSALTFKPSEISWSTGQLASHIAEVYNWYEVTFHQDVMDMAAYKYDKGDISKAENIVAKFEENLLTARAALQRATDDIMFTNWTMVMGGSEPIFPVMPRVSSLSSVAFTVRSRAAKSWEKTRFNSGEPARNSSSRSRASE